MVSDDERRLLRDIRAKAESRRRQFGLVAVATSPEGVERVQWSPPSPVETGSLVRVTISTDGGRSRAALITLRLTETPREGSLAANPDLREQVLRHGRFEPVRPSRRRHASLAPTLLVASIPTRTELVDVGSSSYGLAFPMADRVGMWVAALSTPPPVQIFTSYLSD
jgi:hypothetical protein